MEDKKYLESSIALSRNYQEQANCLQGVTGYGKLASLIGTNLDYLDSFSEYIALCISKSITKNTYEVQYGEKFLGFVKRNLSNLDKIDKNERDRRNIAFLSGMLTEVGLKYGIRGLKALAENKERQKFFESVFFILKSYVEESDQYIYYENANKELRKILKAFPIDAKRKQKIWNMESSDDYESMSNFAEKIDSDSKYALSYLLYAIHAQKYGDQFDNTIILSKYYSLLGYEDNIINEIITENRSSYSIVTFDQKRYLSLARGMVKQFNSCSPELDLNALCNRAVEMSKFDPFYSEKLDLHSHSTYKPQKTIGDIFFDSPETVINACKTAVSQLSLNDNVMENIEALMKSWKIDTNTVMNIMNQAGKYQEDVRKE